MLFSCNSKEKMAIDIYSIKADAIRFKGSPKWINEIELLQYKKNSKFDSLVNRQNIDLMNVDYRKTYNETSILIKEIDYHYDFILILKGNNKTERHSFSNIIVTKFLCNPFDYYKVTQYVYNSTTYKGDECNWHLIPPLPLLSGGKLYNEAFPAVARIWSVQT